MTTVAKLQKRVERLEGICAGAQFLLRKVQARYDDHLGEGMRQQIRQCICDCEQIAMERKQRDDATAARRPA